MKKLFYTLIFAALCLVSCNDDSGLFNLMLDTNQRIARLEELCSELNTNITSLQVIVEAQQSGDYITNITPITKDGQQIGYTITFAKHPAITIYNGEDGKDGVNGTNGTNGQDGLTPVLGAAKDTDGIYYWTLNGSWLLDGDGHKIRVTGEKGDKGDKGDKGATGATGQNGTNGTNGTDGVTPQLKIENDYWYISYDNGSSWTQLGKAKGDKGDTGATGAAGSNGTNGQDGQDGDTMFQSVTYDENNVYFTLADGTMITISLKSSSLIEGTIDSYYTISKYNERVRIAKSNLAYNPKLDSWRFEESSTISRYETGRNKTHADSIWINMIKFGCTGYKGFEPIYFPIGNSFDGCVVYKQGELMATDLEKHDWGKYCYIENGGGRNQWRLLTIDEWCYILYERPNASQLRVNASIDGVSGTILMPDTSTISTRIPSILTEDMNYTKNQWEILESQGCAFLDQAAYWSNITDAGPTYSGSTAYILKAYTISPSSSTRGQSVSGTASSDAWKIRLFSDLVE